jgi:hypothetical protein
LGVWGLGEGQEFHGGMGNAEILDKENVLVTLQDGMARR